MTFRFRRNLILSGIAVMTLAALMLTIEIVPSTIEPVAQRSFPAELTGVTLAAIGPESVQSTPNYRVVLFERKGGPEDQVKASTESMTDMVNASPAELAVPVPPDPAGYAVDSSMLLEYNGRTAELAPFSIAASSMAIEAARTVLVSGFGQLSAELSAPSTGSGAVGGAVATASGRAYALAAPGQNAASSPAQTNSNSPADVASASTSSVAAGGWLAADGSNPNSAGLTGLDQSSAPAVLSLSLAPYEVFAPGPQMNLHLVNDSGPGQGPSTPAAGVQHAATVSTLLPPPPNSSMTADVATTTSASTPAAFPGGGGSGGPSTFAPSTFAPSSLLSATASPDLVTTTPEPASAVLVLPIFAAAAVILRRRRLEKVA